LYPPADADHADWTEIARIVLHIVPYRVRGTTIEITRVYHSSRCWPERL